MGKLKAKKKKIDGITFDSTLESNFYLHLKDKLANKKIKSFEMQVTYILQEPFIKLDNQVYYETHPKYKTLKKDYSKLYKADRNIYKNPGKKYIADFVVHMNDGSTRVIDTKGRTTALFELKRGFFEEKYPEYTLEVICMPTEKSKLIQRLKKAKKSETKANLMKQINKLPDWIDYYKDKALESKKKREKKKLGKS